jgi:hypothetical protein
MVTENTGYSAILERIERELATVEARAQELRSARKVIAELMGVDFKASNEPIQVATGQIARAYAQGRQARGDLELQRVGLTMPEAAEIVLGRAGKPLTSRQIAERLLEGGYPYKKGINVLRSSIGGVLSMKVRDHDTFVKVAPGTFALAEWGLESVDDGAESVESESAESANASRPTLNRAVGELRVVNH